MEEPREGYRLILQAAGSAGLYEGLVQQLQKDFDRANVRVHFSFEQSAEELYSALHEKIYQLLMERFSDYLNVLYVVDVPETAFRDIQITDAVEVSEEVCRLILKREWQKVQMKKRK